LPRQRLARGLAVRRRAGLTGTPVDVR
jgi:hypothetical protein